MPIGVVKNQADEKHWDKAKSIVQEEHPEFKAGSDQFYKYTMGVYKKMTKAASAEELIDHLYYEGVISPFARRTFLEDNKFEEVKTLLKKEGDAGEVVRNALIGAGALTVAGLGVDGAIKGYTGIRNKLKRKQRIEEAKRYEPSINDMDPKLVNESMKTLEKLNPDYADSPLITASTLKSIHMWGGLSPEQANMLKDQEKYKPAREYFREGWKTKFASESFFEGAKDSIVSGLSSGVGAAAVGIGVGAGSLLAAKAINSFTRKKRTNEILDAYPELKKVPSGKIQTSLKTIERVNPIFAKDPLIAGGYIKKIIKGKGVDPKLSEGLAGASGDLADYSPLLSARNAIMKGD